MYSPSVDGKVDRTCPACGHAQGLLLFGLRATRMSSAVSSILFASEQNEELDEAKKKKAKKDEEDLQESGGPASSPLEDVVHMLARASETGNAALMKQAKSTMSKLPSDVKKSLNVLIKNMK